MEFKGVMTQSEYIITINHFDSRGDFICFFMLSNKLITIAKWSWWYENCMYGIIRKMYESGTDKIEVIWI